MITPVSMAVEYLPNKALETDNFLSNLTEEDLGIFTYENVDNGNLKAYM